MTVGIVLGVGLFWALLCGLVKRDQGRVHRELTASERFARRLRELELLIGIALLPAARRAAAAMAEWVVEYRRAVEPIVERMRP